MSDLPVYIMDMGRAAGAKGLRVNGAILIHAGLPVEDQGRVLQDLLRYGERAVFETPYPADEVRQSVRSA